MTAARPRRFRLRLLLAPATMLAAALLVALLAPRAVLAANVPGAPAITSATAGDGYVDLTWSAPGDDGGSPITSYVITGSGNAGTQSAPATATSWVFYPLTNQTSYTFTVAAVNSVGTGAASDPSAAVTPLGSPDPPVLVSAVGGNQQTTISWNPPANDGGFAIATYYISSVNGTATLTVAAPATSATLTGLVNGHTYEFSVVANNSAGPSLPSDLSEDVIPRTVPGPPTAVSGLAGHQSVNLTWSAPTDNGGAAITGYSVTVSPGGATLSAGPGAGSGFAVDGLTDGVGYTFGVAATNVVGPGPDTMSGTLTPTATAPGAPVIDRVVGGDRSATLHWNAPPDGGSPLTGFVITTFPSLTTSVVAPSSTFTTLSGLHNRQGYTFRVAAVNAVGTGPESNRTSVVTPLPAPGPPKVLSALAGDAQVTVSWAPPTNRFGGSVMQYEVVASPGGASSTVDGSRDSAVVGGLTNGTAYTFTVVATNASGSGTASAASLPAIPLSGGGLSVDRWVARHTGSLSSTLTAPLLSTGAPNELLVAFVASGGRPGQDVTYTVSGGGLTWTRAARAVGSPGDAEVWTARTVDALSGIPIVARRSAGSADGSLVVVAFSGGAALGATGSGSGGAGPVEASIRTTSSRSSVWLFVEDQESTSVHPVDAGLSELDYYHSPTGDGFTLEAGTYAPGAGTAVTAAGSWPATDWNAIALEITG